MSLGRGAEWPGERDSGPELASGWAGSWEIRNITKKSELVFCIRFHQPLLVPPLFLLAWGAGVAWVSFGH